MPTKLLKYDLSRFAIVCWTVVREVIPYSTECIPPTVLMLSPTVLNNLHNTEAITHSTEAFSPLYWATSTVLKLSPQYWSYPPQYRCYPPVYWTTSNALNNLHSTEQPPQYCTTSTVLNRHNMGWLKADEMTYSNFSFQKLGYDKSGTVFVFNCPSLHTRHLNDSCS